MFSINNHIVSFDLYFDKEDEEGMLVETSEKKTGNVIYIGPETHFHSGELHTITLAYVVCHGDGKVHKVSPELLTFIEFE